MVTYEEVKEALQPAWSCTGDIAREVYKRGGRDLWNTHIGKVRRHLESLARFGIAEKRPIRVDGILMYEWRKAGEEAAE